MTKHNFLFPLGAMLASTLLTFTSPAVSQDDLVEDVFGNSSSEAPRPEPEQEPEEDVSHRREESDSNVKTRFSINHGSDGIDLGLHLTGGIHQCLRSGTNYVACKGADGGWDLSWGIAGGFLVRPYKYFSVGIDAAYMTMRSRWSQETLSWSDFSLGPIARLHVPFNIMRVSVEPNLGFEMGYIQGNMRLNSEGEQRLDKHLGFMLAAMLGVDFFIIPEFGFGIEARAFRTFYQEVCFDGPDGPICRGEDNISAASCVEQNCYGDEPAEYPWKIFYGVHLIYYL